MHHSAKSCFYGSPFLDRCYVPGSGVLRWACTRADEVGGKGSQGAARLPRARQLQLLRIGHTRCCVLCFKLIKAPPLAF